MVIVRTILFSKSLLLVLQYVYHICLFAMSIVLHGGSSLLLVVLHYSPWFGASAGWCIVYISSPAFLTIFECILSVTACSISFFPLRLLTFSAFSVPFHIFWFFCSVFLFSVLVLGRHMLLKVVCEWVRQVNHSRDVCADPPFQVRYISCENCTDLDLQRSVAVHMKGERASVLGCTIPGQLQYRFGQLEGDILALGGPGASVCRFISPCFDTLFMWCFEAVDWKCSCGRTCCDESVCDVWSSDGIWTDWVFGFMQFVSLAF